MTAARKRLPDRRRHLTVDVDVDPETPRGVKCKLGVGLDAGGRPAEVFLTGVKSGGILDGLLNDAAIVLSLALQHGVAAADIAHSLGLTEADARVSVLGTAIDRVVELGEGAG